MNIKNSGHLFSDIRFWILLFFIVRLYGITNPPLEVAHSWRQVTVNMVSRNFLETNANILYPQVDMAGEKIGITGMEFPFLNYLIYLVSYIFGFQHWYGRLINLIVSTIGILYFFKLIDHYFKKDIAFNASLILLSSIWFAYSRKIMPDTFSVSLVIIGLYQTHCYVTNGSGFRLFGAFILLCIGTLCKLPSGFMLVFSVLILFPINTRPLKRILGVCFMLVSITLINSVWYFYWVPYLVETFGYWHFYMGTSISNGIAEIAENLQLTAEKFYFDALKFSGFVLFVLGIILSMVKKSKTILVLITIGSIAFSLVVLKGGRTFYLHSYYVIPFVPLMSIVAAQTLRYLKNTTLIKIVLLIVISEGVLNQAHDFIIKDSEKHVLTLEKIVNQNIQTKSLIAINGDVNPRDIYFTHRHGWTISNTQLQSSSIDSLKKLGCTYLIIDKHQIHTPFYLNFPICFKNDDYLIFSLKKI